MVSQGILELWMNLSRHAPEPSPQSWPRVLFCPSLRYHSNVEHFRDPVMVCRPLHSCCSLLQPWLPDYPLSHQRKRMTLLYFFNQIHLRRCRGPMKREDFALGALVSPRHAQNTQKLQGGPLNRTESVPRPERARGGYGQNQGPLMRLAREAQT
jgi:hypothetical protein